MFDPRVISGTQLGEHLSEERADQIATASRPIVSSNLYRVGAHVEWNVSFQIDINKIDFGLRMWKAKVLTECWH